MIEVSQLTKNYGKNMAIEGLDFSVEEGDIVGFLGPNGAGKSTTMKILTGLMSPTSGSVSIGGYDIFEHPIEVKRRIGYLPENPPLYRDMYVRDYLSYVARLKRVPRKQIKERVDDVLEKVNITDHQKRLINNLSKGYKQRVGLAQALVSDPDLLILDEPTVGLDPNQVVEIRSLILSLKEKKHTVVLSTHILSEVQATCQKVIIINKGHIIAKDTLKGLITNMSHKSQRQLHVKVRRPSDSLESVLSQVKGVGSVISPTSGEYILDLNLDEDDIQEAVIAKIAQSKAGLLDCHTVSKSLEDVFIQLTREVSNETSGDSKEDSKQ